MLAIDSPLELRTDGPRAEGASGVCSAASCAVPVQTRQWTALAVGSLVVAGLLSLAVVVGRLPVISQFIADPLFFKRCLVVHVDLALLVWFYTFMSAMLGLRSPVQQGWVGKAAIFAAGCGMAAMLAGGVVPGAAPVLSNYIPVIDHPVFLAGLGLFFAAVVVHFLHGLLTASMSRAGGLPEDAAVGLQAAAVAVVLAAATWISARTGLPEGLDAWTFFEVSGWGAGHVLQVANVCAMLAVWLWLAKRATGQAVLSRKAARILFTVLLLPHFVMPLLTWKGTLHQLYIGGATALMRWGIFPVVVTALFLTIRHLRRCRGSISADPGSRLALAGFVASASLTVLGILIGACIRSSTTLIPAHYHASLGAVTAAFMAGAYLILEAIDKEHAAVAFITRFCRAGRRQIILFGIGQSVFAVGFGIGGFYGLGRKTYAAEQHVRSAGELAGLGIMGLGGLLAVVAGLWFLYLMIREMRRWGRSSAALPPHAIPTHVNP